MWGNFFTKKFPHYFILSLWNNSFCPQTAPRWRRGAGARSISSTSTATPMWITPPSARRSSRACSRTRASASAFWHSRTSARRRRSAHSGGRASASSSARATSTPWSRITPPRRKSAPMTTILPAASRDCAPRRTAMFRSFSAGSRHRCAASRITTTGTTACAAPCSWTAAPI